MVTGSIEEQHGVALVLAKDRAGQTRSEAGRQRGGALTMKKTAPVVWRSGSRLGMGGMDKRPRTPMVWPTSDVEPVGCSRHRRWDISLVDRGCRHRGAHGCCGDNPVDDWHAEP
jgi:hypothetical protein